MYIFAYERGSIAYDLAKPDLQYENMPELVYLHPGVEALGYVNKTTPDLASSSNSFFRVVFSPSWVSISPPKPSRSIMLPVLTAFAEVCSFLPPFEEDLTEFAFLTWGRVVVDSSAALRFLNSTIVIDLYKLGVEI